MSITRDQDVPAEMVELFQTFVHAADGHLSPIVLEAAANFLVAAIHNHVRMSGATREQAQAIAVQIGSRLPALVAGQWQRQPRPGDVEVPSNGN